MTGGRLKDGGGILDGVSQMIETLNAAGIPAVPDGDGTTRGVVWTGTVYQPEAGPGERIEFVTLTESHDWAAPGGNEDDLGAVGAAIIAALNAAEVRYLPYWGPGFDTTARNVLVFQTSAVVMSAGWPT